MTALAGLEAAIDGGRPPAVVLVSGDLVLAEPAATSLAERLATRGAARVERHRRPPGLGPFLADLETYSLFGGGKVVLIVDTAIFADRTAAATLLDDAEAGLPVEPASPLGEAQRQAASRLLQALRVFGLDPDAGGAEEAVGAFPEWALQGGPALRKRKPRGRGKKEVEELRSGLVALLAAAREAGMRGFAEGDLAQLGAILERGLPAGHHLVLAEHAVAAGHPLVRALGAAGGFVELGRVEVGKGGEWVGLPALVTQLESETGTRIARDAVAELARRTLRQTGDLRHREVDGESTARFAAEYRKLADQVARAAGGATIDRATVVANVEDRGEEDVWQILDALGEGRGHDALARYRRLVAAAEDALAARLSFFGLLAGFCRQLAAVGGLMRAGGVPPGVKSYAQFRDRWAPRLQEPLPGDLANPIAKLHPFRLHRAYLAASGASPRFLARLPWLVLETETLIKGDGTDPDAAIGQLLGTLAAGVRGG